MSNKKRRALAPLIVLAATIALTLLYFSRLEQPLAQQENHNPEAPREEQTIGVRKADLLSGLVEARNTTINLTGIVLDENNTPLSGVSVLAKIRKSTLAASTELGEDTKSLQLTTNSEGIFEILGEIGYWLDIKEIARDGYTLLSKQSQEFNYYSGEIRFQENPEPVEFYMVKDINQIDLYQNTYKIATPWEGEELLVNLRQGVVEEGGDILIKASRGEKIERMYDWTLVIEVPSGGILEVQEGQPVLIAPRGPYPDTWSVEHQRLSDDYIGGLSTNFFVLTKEGQYARVQLRATPDQIEMGARSICLRVFINESGGRVLQDSSTSSQF